VIGRFRLGGVFPAGDAVARFVVTLAMFANDLLRSSAMFGDLGDDDPEAQGRRLMLVRYQASAFHEVVKFVRQARKLPNVAAFIDSLPDDAATAFATMTNAADELGPWLKKHRDVTFHYAEMSQVKLDAGKDEVMGALANAADTESLVRSGENVGAGFPFADEVAAHLFDATKERTTVLRHGVLGATDFALAAGRMYISRQDPQAIRVE
jgi:hypothetical protein